MTAFAQGEIYARKIENTPDGLVPFTEKDTAGRWIISHSESGHHHLMDAPGVDVMERTTDVPEGIRILYAIVKEPTRLWQDAATPHDAHDVATKAKDRRVRSKHLGFHKPKSRLPGSKDSKFKMKVGGLTVLRSEDN